MCGEVDTDGSSIHRLNISVVIRLYGRRLYYSNIEVSYTAHRIGRLVG